MTPRFTIQSHHILLTLTLLNTLILLLVELIKSLSKRHKETPPRTTGKRWWGRADSKYPFSRRPCAENISEGTSGSKNMATPPERRKCSTCEWKRGAGVKAVCIEIGLPIMDDIGCNRWSGKILHANTEPEKIVVHREDGLVFHSQKLEKAEKWLLKVLGADWPRGSEKISPNAEGVKRRSLTQRGWDEYLILGKEPETYLEWRELRKDPKLLRARWDEFFAGCEGQKKSNADTPKEGGIPQWIIDFKNDTIVAMYKALVRDYQGLVKPEPNADSAAGEPLCKSCTHGFEDKSKAADSLYRWICCHVGCPVLPAANCREYEKREKKTPAAEVTREMLNTPEIPEGVKRYDEMVEYYKLRVTNKDLPPFEEWYEGRKKDKKAFDALPKGPQTVIGTSSKKYPKGHATTVSETRGVTDNQVSLESAPLTSKDVDEAIKRISQEPPLPPGCIERVTMSMDDIRAMKLSPEPYCHNCLFLYENGDPKCWLNKARTGNYDTCEHWMQRRKIKEPEAKKPEEWHEKVSPCFDCDNRFGSVMMHNTCKVGYHQTDRKMTCMRYVPRKDTNG